MTAILVVDDNPQNLKLARVLLRCEGYEVVVAHDATEARTQLDAANPPLVLMDVQLPGTDGLELTRQLRGDERWKHLVIIAMTAYAMKGDRERALEAGCDDYVSKPIDGAALVGLVARWLSRR